MIELFVLSGPDAGTSVKLQPGDQIGRGESCVLRLRDRSISRAHAQLEERGGSFAIVDTGSTNGIHLKGERVSEIALVDFLEFKAGEVELRARVGRAEKPKDTKPKPVEKEPEAEISFSFGGGVVSPSASSDAEPEIEIEWEDEGQASAEPAPAPVSKPSALAERDAKRAALVSQMAGKQGGLMKADLSQFPAWVQALVGVVVLGFGAALFYGIYTLVTSSRAS